MLRRRRILLVALTMLFLGGGAVASHLKVLFEVKTLRIRAKEQLANRDYGAAAVTLRELHREAKGRGEAIEALLLLGKAHFAKGELKQAEAAWSRLVREHAESRWAEKARFLLADAALKRGDAARATELLRERAAFLTGPEHRGEVAALYLEIADKAYDGTK
ncbi:MAG: tetratricopeptide repeat protein, partial [Planctomycetota bacterium]